MNTDTLYELTLKQAEYTKQGLEDFILNKGPTSDDGFDADTGSLDCARIMQELAFDDDTEGCIRFFNRMFDDISADGVCPAIHDYMKAHDIEGFTS